MRSAFPWLPAMRWQSRGRELVEYRVTVTDPRGDAAPYAKAISSTWQPDPNRAWANLAMVAEWWLGAAQRAAPE